MDISSIVFGSDGRLRCGWRFLIFAFGFIFFAVLLVEVLTKIYPIDTNADANTSAVHFLLYSLTTLIPAVVVGWLCNKFLDRLPFTSLGMSINGGSIAHFAIGLIVGALTLALAVLIPFIFGGLTFSADPADWNSIVRTLLLSFLVFAVAAASEEALCRGYPLQTFFHSDLKVVGILFTAFIFASGHLGNPNASALSWLNTFVAGIWFAVAYWRTRDLWFPIGIHLMWNWMQGALFGIEVSGLTDITSAPLLKEIDRGPAWLTGEAYGIEAGVACTAALIISTLAIYFLPKVAGINNASEVR
jgi:membrane protease YdiL (CAAX protease family)